MKENFHARCYAGERCLNKIYISTRPENQRSIHVAERIGMNAEGSFIKPYNGKDLEHTIYSKNRECSGGLPDR